MTIGARVTVLLLVATHSAIPAQEPPRWSLAAPDFEVGGFAADGDDALAELGGVTILSDGNVVVGDRVEPFLKVFSADGDLLRSVGRYGEGPGEYEYVYEMDWCAPDELSVRDVDGRVHRYTRDLDYVSTDVVSLEAIGGGVGYNQDCHPNGLQIVTGWGDFRAQFKEGLFDATAPVVLLRGQAVVKNFGQRLSSERLGSVRADGSPSGSGPHPFGRATVVALGATHVYLGSATDYEIEVYDLAGDPRPPIRWSGPDLDYDDDLVAALAERAVSQASEQARPRLRRFYAEMPELDQLPAYDRVLVSDSDQVWVRHFVRPDAVGETWFVFGPQHQLVGQLALPLRSTLWEVRGDRVVYSVLDELDVPVVRISRIER